MKKMFVLVMTAMLAGSLSGMAHATAVRGNVQQQVVSFADLNLQSEADAAVLLERIESAARNVCGLHAGPMPLEIKAHLQICAREATARAVADVKAPQLTRLGQLVVRNFE
ncbi:MAG TPA: UrcA family protein [Steroidobacteraceae bacterium]|jgi:UrcA family protein